MKKDNVMSEQKNPKFLVRVSCTTYNHAPYIIDAFNGFTMQQTTFPFVCVIIDDASTDGEQEVISRYLEDNFDLEDKTIVRNEETENYRLVSARHKTNLNCYFVVILLKFNHYSVGKTKSLYIKEFINTKYVAICDGDDYWINPEKLQKQVSFMDKHPDYVLCHTDFDLTTGGFRNHGDSQSADGNAFPSCIIRGLGNIGTLTVLYRTESDRRTPKLWVGKGWPMGDYPRWIELSHEGMFKRLPDVTAKYRILSQSASHGNYEKEVRFIEATREVKVFYAQYYGVDLSNEGYSCNYYIDMMRTAFKHRNKAGAKHYKKEAQKRCMESKKMYVYYYATVCPLMGNVFRKYLNR